MPTGRGVSAEPGKAAVRRHHEEQHELRTPREDRSPGVELRADLRRVLGRFIDLETDDGGAIGPSEDDYAVGVGRQEAGITRRRLR